MIDYFHNIQNTSFGGIPCAQYFCDFYLWEVILNENPQLVRIIELGTWKGGFSFYLNAQAQARGMYFSTYDSVEHFDINHRPPSFINRDIFANYGEIGQYISTGPCALFCDNGNKPREVKIFAPYLTNDSILIVHDWMTEFMPNDVPDELEEVYGDFCDNLGSMSRVFKKKG